MKSAHPKPVTLFSKYFNNLTFQDQLYPKITLLAKQLISYVKSDLNLLHIFNAQKVGRQEMLKQN